MTPVMTEADLAAFLAAEFREARGISVERVTEAGLIARMEAGPGDLRPGGTVSGPAMFTLADVAIYLAILSRIGPVALAVTTSASIDFLRKPPRRRRVAGRSPALEAGTATGGRGCADHRRGAGRASGPCQHDLCDPARRARLALAWTKRPSICAPLSIMSES